MGIQADDMRLVRQLLRQAIASLELAMDLAENIKEKEPQRPLLLAKIAKQKLAELRQAEAEARRHE